MNRVAKELRSQDYRRELHRRIASELKPMSEVSALKGLFSVALDWGVIASAIALGITFPNPVVYAVAAIAIASRQHALLIIMHDASHFRLIRNKTINDVVSNCLLAYPMLIRTESYRTNHLDHHRYTNTDDDPDWTRKAGNPDWEFPKTRWQLFKMIARDLVGGGFLSSLIAIYALGAKNTHSEKKSNKAKLGFYAFWLVAGTIITVTHSWLYVLLFWFLPAWTVLPAILRIRSIAEHFGLENTHELNASRNYHCTPLEIAVFAPHNVGLHLDHHLFPSVPFYNLGILHRRLMDEPIYAENSHQSEGLFGLDRRSVERDISPVTESKAAAHTVTQ